MLIQIVLLILMAVIGYLNYCLSKSYWFHESDGVLSVTGKKDLYCSIRPFHINDWLLLTW